jgi:hypothetical protein
MAGNGNDATEMAKTMQLMWGSVFGLAVGLYAANLAYKRVLERKFCETCVEFMQIRPLASFSFEELMELSREMSSREPLLSLISHRNVSEDGSVVLHWCGNCQDGYLESTVEYEGRWAKGNSDSRYENFTRQMAYRVSSTFSRRSEFTLLSCKIRWRDFKKRVVAQQFVVVSSRIDAGKFQVFAG